ncbi:MAG: hypothetical protein ABSE17_03805 [Candidatus Levyibacteriota bacterium]|jgi:hypothetical protein
MIEQAIAYEPTFDRVSYLALSSVSSERKRELDLYTKRQLETHLGERFGVLLSSTRYEIKEGQIFGENTDEPFINMISRGVEYRKRHGNETDRDREQAELAGFTIIQKTLTTGDVPIGTMILSISPPGRESSSYQHNFYDIFTLKDNGEGRFIEARRYSSSLSAQETVALLKNVDVVGIDYQPTPECLLSNPIKIESRNDSFITADNIHKYLHREHEYLSEVEFAEIIRICTPLITSYINTLSEMPIDTRMQLLTLNAILNKADMALVYIRNGSKYPYLDSYAFTARTEEILDLGSRPVRQVMTGCGASGGFSLTSFNKSISSPFSVSEFSDQEWFTCPKCHYKADGPVGDTCPGCGLTKEEYVEESGVDACA